MTSPGDDGNGVIKLYAAFPNHLKLALVLGIILLVGCPLIGVTLSFVPGVVPLMVILTVLTICMTAFNLLRVLALSRPALIIDDAGITFRNISMPWSIISSVAPVQTSTGTRLGIALTDCDKVYIREDLAGRKMLMKALRRSLDRYGALPIPPMKNLRIDQLQSLITAAWPS